jgi:hypothetical protein
MEVGLDWRAQHAGDLVLPVDMERKERLAGNAVDFARSVAMLMPLWQRGRQRITAPLVQQVAMELWKD